MKLTEMSREEFKGFVIGYLTATILLGGLAWFGLI